MCTTYACMHNAIFIHHQMRCPRIINSLSLWAAAPKIHTSEQSHHFPCHILVFAALLDIICYFLSFILCVPMWKYTYAPWWTKNEIMNSNALCAIWVNTYAVSSQIHRIEQTESWFILTTTNRHKRKGKKYELPRYCDTDNVTQVIYSCTPTKKKKKRCSTFEIIAIHHGLPR